MRIVVKKLSHAAGETWEFSRTPIAIGNHPDCEVYVMDKTAGRRHVALVWREEQLCLVELGSARIARVNGDRVRSLGIVPLDSGAKIELGDGLYLSVEYEGGGDATERSDWTEHPVAKIRELLQKAAAESDVHPQQRREAADAPAQGVRIVATLADGQKTSWDFSRLPILIGSDPACDAVIATIEQYHAALVWRDGSVWLAALPCYQRIRLEGDHVGGIVRLASGARVEFGDDAYVTVAYGVVESQTSHWTEHPIPKVRTHLESMATDGPPANRRMREAIEETLRLIASHRALIERADGRLFFPDMVGPGLGACGVTDSQKESMTRAGEYLYPMKELAREGTPESKARALERLRLAEEELRSVAATITES